jgi:hypothetical protein
MYWECPALVASESEPMGSMSRFDGLQLPLLEFGKLLNNLTRDPAVTGQPDVGSWSLRDFWYTHVGAYSGRALTRLTDHLPALSGLAFYMSKVFDDNTYAAGLWAADPPPRATLDTRERRVTWVEAADANPTSDDIRRPKLVLGVHDGLSYHV